jgi:hypothetical protein
VKHPYSLLQGLAGESRDETRGNAEAAFPAEPALVPTGDGPIRTDARS